MLPWRLLGRKVYIAQQTVREDEGTTTNTKWVLLGYTSLKIYFVVQHQQLSIVKRYYQALWVIHKECGFNWITVPLQKKRKTISRVSPGISQHLFIFRQFAAVMHMHVVHYTDADTWFNYTDVDNVTTEISKFKGAVGVEKVCHHQLRLSPWK